MIGTVISNVGEFVIDLTVHDEEANKALTIGLKSATAIADAAYTGSPAGFIDLAAEVAQAMVEDPTARQAIGVASQVARTAASAGTAAADAAVEAAATHTAESTAGAAITTAANGTAEAAASATESAANTAAAGANEGITSAAAGGTTGTAAGGTTEGMTQTATAGAAKGAGAAVDVAKPTVAGATVRALVHSTAGVAVGVAGGAVASAVTDDPQWLSTGASMGVDLYSGDVGASTARMVAAGAGAAVAAAVSDNEARDGAVRFGLRVGQRMGGAVAAGRGSVALTEAGAAGVGIAAAAGADGDRERIARLNAGYQQTRGTVGAGRAWAAAGAGLTDAPASPHVSGAQAPSLVERTLRAGLSTAQVVTESFVALPAALEVARAEDRAAAKKRPADARAAHRRQQQWHRVAGIAGETAELIDAVGAEIRRGRANRRA